uniref:AMP-dependent synthetase/ligase domain-containing protein n=1 Tax=Stomoxys calcitrans TaxID=35570 RepID=A0A1I8PPG4_STOCA
MFTVTGTTYNKMEKVWSGPNLKNLYSDEMTLGEAIVRRLITTPGKVIQIMGTTGESLTALEFLKCSMNVAHNILKMGLNCRDIVGLYAQHSVHEATVMMAAFLCGTPVHALFPGFDQKTVISLYENTRPKFIFCDKENYESALSANETLDLKARIVVLTGQVQGVTHISELVQNGAQSLDINAFPCTGLNGSDTAAILCSSGTTGTPKGVMCSHQALLYSNIYHTVTCDSVVLCFSTMYWASGILNLISALLHSSLRIVPEKPYCPEYFLSLVKHYQITHVLCGGNQVAELAFHQSKKHVRESLQSIDTLLCGGAKIPQLVQEKLLDILSDNTKRPGMAVIYGLSEIAGGLSINGGYPYDFQPFSEGKLWPNKRVCIVDKSDQRLGPNECGEILVYSPYTWQGYYQNSETTANAMKGEWFCSGDIGYFDELGFLHVIGREKEMFKWNNFQICPQPIEDVLLRLEGIAEVCVFPIPDMVSENLTACAIVRTPNEKGQELTVEMVNEYAVKNLDSIYLLIGGVYFMDYLPKTGSGKVQRHKVASMIMNMKERNLVHTKSSIDHAVLNVCN